LFLGSRAQLVDFGGCFVPRLDRQDRLARGRLRHVDRFHSKKLLVLPEETVVFPGHGPKTTIGQEKRTNPFLMGLSPAP